MGGVHGPRDGAACHGHALLPPGAASGPRAWHGRRALLRDRASRRCAQRCPRASRPARSEPLPLRQPPVTQPLPSRCGTVSWCPCSSWARMSVAAELGVVVAARGPVLRSAAAGGDDTPRVRGAHRRKVHQGTGTHTEHHHHHRLLSRAVRAWALERPGRWRLLLLWFAGVGRVHRAARVGAAVLCTLAEA